MKITKISKKFCSGRFARCMAINAVEFKAELDGYTEFLCSSCLWSVVNNDKSTKKHGGIKSHPVKYEDLTQEDIQDMSMGEYLYSGGPTGLPPNVAFQTYVIRFDDNCVIVDGNTLKKMKSEIFNY